MKRKGSAVFRFAFVLAKSIMAILLIAVSSAFLAMAAELTFDLKVEHGRVPDNMRVIRVKEGDVVKLRCTTDRPLVLHLHGYNIEKRIMPGPPSELTFTAYATGRFPVHVHAQGADDHAHEEAPLVNIEVYPR
jgi:hypothetical protein